MAAKVGSVWHSFIERSKERLLNKKGSELRFGSFVGNVDNEAETTLFHKLCDRFVNFWIGLKEAHGKLCDMGRSDPRKVVFAIKAGLSLAFASLVIFFREPLQEVNKYAIWAILTVVVVFEFSVGISYRF